MGDPKRNRKQFEGPKRLWDKKRIDEEKALREEFGLKNARELWKMQTILRRIRREARRLLSKKGADLDRRTNQLMGRAKRFLISNPAATVDDVLLLTPRDILSRRLQTIVVRKHLARTNRQARQFIVHGHISVQGQRVTAPSYLVSFQEEDQINWYKHPLQTAPATSDQSATEENGEKQKTAKATPVQDVQPTPTGDEAEPAEPEAEAA
ncbi:30S ribosomal protein S4 [Candidatus Micrarchaeota archaeon]|nr:30S ribosomal protein S4 [Candidatus Micrarchaeota archaeon]